jgi:2-keto-4-pentenoate hydratase
MKSTLFILASAFIALGRVALAEPPTPAVINQLTEDYFARRPSQTIHAGMSLADAHKAQQDFVARLIPKLGESAGFKVGLTSKAVQETVGATGPMRGVLLRSMLMKDGASVSAKFGSRPIWEPDLIVTVKNAGINLATTPLEAARHLDEVVAFIELPDRVVAESEKPDAQLLVAVNAGARLGVTGQRVKVQATAEFLAALENMTVTATDQTGAELATAKGTALLGHPLNPVLWLIKDLAVTGENLKAGDVISLGSFAKPQPPQPGQTVKVRYDGLPGGPIKATVRFGE